MHKMSKEVKHNTPEEQFEILKAYLDGKKVIKTGGFKSYENFTPENNPEFDKKSIPFATFDFYRGRYEIVQEMQEFFIIARVYVEKEGCTQGWRVSSFHWSEQELDEMQKEGIKFQVLQSVFVPKN